MVDLRKSKPPGFARPTGRPQHGQLACP